MLDPKEFQALLRQAKSVGLEGYILREFTAFLLKAKMQVDLATGGKVWADIEQAGECAQIPAGLEISARGQSIAEDIAKEVQTWIKRIAVTSPKEGYVRGMCLMDIAHGQALIATGLDGLDQPLGKGEDDGGTN